MVGYDIAETQEQGKKQKQIENDYKEEEKVKELKAQPEVQCVRKVAVHLGYGTVRLKCDGTR